MRDMKIFFWKTLLMQTIFYGLFYLIVYSDSLTHDGRLLWKPFVITFYVISVIFTFIIPMIKIYLKKY
jgi:hypothetical protein